MTEESTFHRKGTRSSTTGWQATCPCGWRSPWYAMEESAMRESRAHVLEEEWKAGERARRNATPQRRKGLR